MSERRLLSGPVILVHLIDERRPGYVVCADAQWAPPADDAYRGVPRVLCEACRRAALRRPSSAPR